MLPVSSTGEGAVTYLHDEYQEIKHNFIIKRKTIFLPLIVTAVDADTKASGQWEGDRGQVVCLLVGVLEFESEFLEEHGHQCYSLCDCESLTQATFTRNTIEENECGLFCMCE